jgi:uroporphyrinogen decarboxylase
VKPRERVLLALNHREPDKVPIDLGATNISSMVSVAYHNLRQHLGMKPDPDPEISHNRQGTVYPLADLLEHYQVDFRPVTMKKAPCWVALRTLPSGDWFDEFNIRWKKSLYYYDAVNHPLADCTVEDLDKRVWPDPYEPARVEGLREQARGLYETTDYAIVADIICRGPFEHACRLRGFEQFCLDLALDARFAMALLDKATEFIIGLWDVYLGAVGDYVQVVCQGEDLGTQNSLIISPDTYRKFIKPCHQRIFGFVHSKTDAKVFLHSDGSIYDIIPDFIEVGVDILNPVQYSAAKMELRRLKKDFGQDLCFWGGGIDVQQALYKASLKEIEREVRRNIEIMAPGGGYVFAPTHNVQPDVPPASLHKVYATALKYRQYPMVAKGE